MGETDIVGWVRSVLSGEIETEIEDRGWVGGMGSEGAGYWCGFGSSEMYWKGTKQKTCDERCCEALKHQTP